MDIAYADPPYPGMAAKHYRNHPDYGGEVDHELLIKQLAGYDGWILHTSSTALPEVLAAAARADVTEYRIMSWVKPFASAKRGVPVMYAWEPVIVKAARKPQVNGRIIMRDWIAEPMTMRRGVAGAKPEGVCRWLFEMVAARPDDQLIDLFPGSGAVSRAWRRWASEPKLPFSSRAERMKSQAVELI